MNYETENIIRNITERFGWRNTRKLLGNGLGVTAVGLDPFVVRAQEAAMADASLNNFIHDFWKSLIFSGSRLIKIYKLEENEIARIQTSFSGLTRDTSEFNVHYPAPVPKPNLFSCDSELHFAETRTDIVNEAQVETTVLLAKAFYTETIELDATHLSDAGLELKANGGEIKCKTRQVTQCYNTVMLIPSKNLLILTVDLSVLPRSESSRQQFIVEQFVRHTSGVNLRSPIELFPIIQDMYEKIDGRISSMSFITADGNTSSLKLKPSQQCLRTDSYHHGGETASPILIKYKLGKIWDVPQPASQTLSIELTLPGQRAMLDKPEKRLYEAIVENCPTIETVMFIVNKILESLSTVDRKKKAKTMNYIK